MRAAIASLTRRGSTPLSAGWTGSESRRPTASDAPKSRQCEPGSRDGRDRRAPGPVAVDVRHGDPAVPAVAGHDGRRVGREAQAGSRRGIVVSSQGDGSRATVIPALNVVSSNHALSGRNCSARNCAVTGLACVVGW